MNPDFQLLFEQSPDVLLVLLPDAPRYTMVGATRSRYEATHTTPAQTLGRGLFELFPDNPDDPAATGTANLRASLDTVRATRAADTMAVQKYDIRGPDGTFQAKYWSPKNIPVLSEAGEVLYILHRVEDVTELVRASELGEELRGRTQAMEREVIARSRELSEANRDLRAANVKLGELDVAKTAFFSNVSHEFRTPLTLMLGPLEDALADKVHPLSKSQKDHLTMAYDNALRLLKLVNALLDFSRLEAGRLRALYAPLGLATFTAELAGMFQSAAIRGDVRLVVDCPPLSEPVWVDRDMWEKIVPNLVSNAFKFTHEGEIAVRLREDDTHAILEVADTGIGIPEAELPRIFERFHRVTGAAGRTYEGTGIGLSLVRELVGLHGGRVSVESELGKGTTFRVAIPKGSVHLPPESLAAEPADLRAGRAAAAHAVEAERWVRGKDRAPAAAGGAAEGNGHGTSEQNAAVAQEGRRARVIVADDNADLREYIAGLLSPSYDVTAVADGQRALEAARVSPPDIVVSDVMMPNLDGLGLVRELRADPATASIPIILLSARAGEEASIEGLDAGSDDYLVKPFSARELVTRVRNHVEMARARRALIMQLEAANRELDAFSYSVSHDLRAPLRAISGFSQSLQADSADRLDADGKADLQRILNATKNMGELIEGLLSLARLSRAELVRKPVDVSTIAREVAAQLQGPAAAAGRQVDYHIEDGLVAVGDSRLVRVILENLIGNATKFTGKVASARVEVGTVARDGESAFFVRDNGAGFDMSYATKLFAPFQRMHAPTDFEGHGIGLATVLRIVNRHGGRIWADSRVGDGATFYFTLSA